MFAACAGERQSPIDIVTNDLVMVDDDDDTDLEPFGYINYDVPLPQGNWTLVNNGYTREYYFLVTSKIFLGAMGQKSIFW